ncbi:MAG: methyltransferase [Oscillospiraceae bacterium]
MSGFILLIPFILIRFGLLSIFNKKAIKRAAYFAPLIEKEQVAYWFYQISNIAIFVYMFFLKIDIEQSFLFYISIIIYVFGVILLALSVINFASPSQEGLNLNGLYRLSRNPMYVAYFIYFIGCVLLTQSLILLGFVLVFQITAHWIILSEERWCVKKFGEDYTQYVKKVRRYI